MHSHVVKNDEAFDDRSSRTERLTIKDLLFMRRPETAQIFFNLGVSVWCILGIYRSIFSLVLEDI